MGFGDCDDSVCTSIPQDLDFISSDEGVDEPLNGGGEKYFTKKMSSSPSSYSGGNAASTSKDRLNNLLPMYASCTDLEMTEDEGEGGANEDSRGATRIPPPRYAFFMLGAFEGSCKNSRME